MPGMRRWRPATGLVAVSLVAAAAACNPAGGTDRGSGQHQPFVVARTGAMSVLDPAKATSFTDVQTLDLVYDTLLETNADGELKPGLAKQWDISRGGKTITLSLRQGVTFHDGAALTAGDAKATLERILDEDTGSASRSYYVDIEQITTPDKHTLVLRLDEANTSLLYALSYGGASILDQGDIDSGTIARHPNGTGPFRWKSWEQGQQLTLAANRGWWGGAPRLGTVEFRVIPDEASILSGMKAGSFSLGQLSDPNVARQAKGSDVELVPQSDLAYHVLMLNGRRGPLQQVKVRQAIACAIDRRQVLQTVYYGYGEVTGPITSPAFSYDPTAGLPCDPPDVGTAKQLLAQAGFADGVTLDTPVLVGNYATATAVAQSLQAQLKKIGVQLNLQQQQTNVFVENWLNADFDASVTRNGGSFDPYLMYGRYFTSDASLSTPAGLSDPTLDRLLRQGKASTDPDTRQRVFGQLQRELLRLSPWVWLFSDTNFYLLGPQVRGFAPAPGESLEDLLLATHVQGAGG